MSDFSNRRSHVWGQIVFAVSCLIGVSWSALAIHAGRPINSPTVPFVLYQLITGFFAGIVAPRWCWVAWVGTILAVGFVFLLIGRLSSNSTAAIGFVFLLLFCLPTLFGGAIGAVVNRLN